MSPEDELEELEEVLAEAVISFFLHDAIPDAVSPSTLAGSTVVISINQTTVFGAELIVNGTASGYALHVYPIDSEAYRESTHLFAPYAVVAREELAARLDATLRLNSTFEAVFIHDESIDRGGPLLWRIASITKTYTAAAILEAFKDDLEALDEPLVKFLRDDSLAYDSFVDEYGGNANLRPSRPGVLVDEDEWEQWPITLRQVMSHLAGLDERIVGQLPPLDDVDDFDLEQYLVDRSPPRLHQPDLVPTYSNFGFSLAGLVGMHHDPDSRDNPAYNFQSFMHKYLPAELTLQNTQFVESVAAVQRLLLPQNYFFAFQPAGSGISSAGDMDEFAKYLLRTRSESSSPMFDARALSPLGIALGLYQNYFGNTTAFMHDGNMPGYESRMMLVPEGEMSFFLSTAVRNEHGSLTVRDRFTAHLAEVLADGTPLRTPETVGNFATDANSPFAGVEDSFYTSTRVAQTDCSSFLSMVFSLVSSPIVEVKGVDATTLAVHPGMDEVTLGYTLLPLESAIAPTPGATSPSGWAHFLLNSVTWNDAAVEARAIEQGIDFEDDLAPYPFLTFTEATSRYVVLLSPVAGFDSDAHIGTTVGLMAGMVTLLVLTCLFGCCLCGSCLARGISGIPVEDERPDFVPAEMEDFPRGNESPRSLITGKLSRVSTRSGPLQNVLMCHVCYLTVAPMAATLFYLTAVASVVTGSLGGMRFLQILIILCIPFLITGWALSLYGCFKGFWFLERRILFFLIMFTASFYVGWFNDINMLGFTC